MEGTVLMKSVTGDWFPTTLALNSANNQMTWLKQDGKSLNQYGIVSPVEVSARVGQSKKFCFEVLNPTTKRSFIYSALNDDDQAKWIAAFNQVLKTPGKEAAPAAPAALPAVTPVVAAEPTSLLRRHASSSSAETRPTAASSSVSETRPAAASSVSEPTTAVPVAARPAASSSVSESTGAPPVTKKSSMFDNKEAPQTGSSCVVCNSAVYKMEEVIVDRMMMHKQCFQCEHCKRQLTMGNFACINGNMFYCKPHYFEVFSQSGGKYEKAFGDAGFEKKALNSFTPGG